MAGRFDGPGSQQLEVEAQYSGYLPRQAAEARQLRASEAIQLPDDLDYDGIGGLSAEMRERLVRPGQSRLARLAEFLELPRPR